jgi:hypothetical protein
MKRAALWAALGALGGFWYAAPARAEQADAAPPAHALLPGSDGVYDRFDGSLALALAAGVELEAGEPRGALRASAHYWWTAGVYARYADAFGAEETRAARVLSFGVDVRPLFLPRFARNYEQGPALLDLTLDSLSLSAGAFFAKPEAADFGDQKGFDMGLGFGVPLLARAAGPWLEARAERRLPDHGDAAWLFSLYLSLSALTLTTDSHP